MSAKTIKARGACVLMLALILESCSAYKSTPETTRTKVKVYRSDEKKEVLNDLEIILWPCYLNRKGTMTNLDEKIYDSIYLRSNKRVLR